MAKNKEKEELTEKMHSEFSVSESADDKYITWTALRVIDDGLLTKDEAMDMYGVTEEYLEKHRKEWEELRDE